MTLNESERIVCDSCDDRITFALQSGAHTVNIGFGTVLECLRIAEMEGAAPKIPRGWWQDAE